MVRIRMQRLGRKNLPFYRINAVEKKTRRNGPVIEALGFFDPLANDPAKQVQINEERIKFWLSKGAQPSDTVRDFLAKRGIGDLKAWEADREHDRKVVAENKAKAAAAPADEKADKPKAEKPAKPEKKEEPKEEAKA
jgi:small subunit ribosomal protein S16